MRRVLEVAIERLLGERPPDPRPAARRLAVILSDRKSPLPERRWCARQLLAQTPPDAESVLAILDDPSEQRPLRRWCAQVLGELNNVAVVRRLHAHAIDRQVPSGVRAACVAALATPHGKDKFLQLADWNERRLNVPVVKLQWARAAAAGCFRGDDSVATKLVELFRTPDSRSWVREACLESLAQVGGKIALNTLREALRKKTRRKAPVGDRGAAAKALGILGVRDVADELGKILADKDADQSLRVNCAESLGRMRKYEVLLNILGNVEPIAERKESDERVRVACARAMHGCEDSKCRARLSQILTDTAQPKNLRLACAATLGRAHDPASHQALVEVFSQRTTATAVRVACVDFLDVPELTRVMSHEAECPDVREACARRLGMLQSSSARVALENQLNDSDDSLRAVCVDGLYPLGSGDTALRKKLEDLQSDRNNSRALRNTCAAVLGKLTDERIVNVQMEVFLASAFRRANPQEKRVSGRLRTLYESFGYKPQKIDQWLEPVQSSSGETTWSHLASLAQICLAHMIAETCTCCEYHEDRRGDWYEKKCLRCYYDHVLNSLNDSSCRLTADYFLRRAIIGPKDPLREARGFSDTILFPLLTTPGNRRLTAKWVTKENKRRLIICEDKGDRPVLGEVVAPPDNQEDSEEENNPSVLALWCPTCREFVGRHGQSMCREGKHLWQGKRVDPDVGGKIKEVPISCCAFHHLWHADLVRCPGCERARRGGSRYRSLQIFVPADDTLLEE